MSGLAVTGTAVVVAAIANVSNPSQFYKDRSLWNELLGDLKLSAWDVWVSFFSMVTPYWLGHGADTVQRYIRFQLIGMFDELGRVATEMSNVLTGLAWDIAEYDLKLVGLLVSASAAFTALLPLSATPAGKLTLGAACVTFLTLLSNLMQDFMGRIRALDLKLQTVGHKVFELRGLFHLESDKLHLKDTGTDPNLWQPAAPVERS
jgi:hypothetical protein